MTASQVITQLATRFFRPAYWSSGLIFHNLHRGLKVKGESSCVWSGLGFFSHLLCLDFWEASYVSGNIIHNNDEISPECKYGIFMFTATVHKLLLLFSVRHLSLSILLHHSINSSIIFWYGDQYVITELISVMKLEKKKNSRDMMMKHQITMILEP